MPQCLKCGAELQVNEEGVAPVLCDRCAGAATSRAQRGLSTGTFRDYPATTALVAFNVLVMLAMIAVGGISGAFNNQDLISQWGANVGSLTLGGQYWRLVTAGFIHHGIMHIAFNMWALWSLGQLSEKLFGSWITAAVYLLTGVGGALLSVFVHPLNSEVGASGAIFGIAGAILSGVKFGSVSLSAGQKQSIVGSMIFFAGFNLAFGAAVPGIDNWCHIGGFATGLVFGVPLATANASGKKSFEWMTIVLAALVLSSLGWRVSATKGEIFRLENAAETQLEERNYPAAIGLLERATSINSDDYRTQLMLGYAYEQNQEEDKAISAYTKALGLDPTNKFARQELHKLQGNSADDGK